MQDLGSFLSHLERDVDVRMPSTGSHSHTVFETRSLSHPDALLILVLPSLCLVSRGTRLPESARPTVALLAHAEPAEGYWPERLTP